MTIEYVRTPPIPEPKIDRMIPIKEAIRRWGYSDRFWRVRVSELPSAVRLGGRLGWHALESDFEALHLHMIAGSSVR